MSLTLEVGSDDVRKIEVRESENSCTAAASTAPLANARGDGMATLATDWLCGILGGPAACSS